MKKQPVLLARLWYGAILVCFLLLPSVALSKTIGGNPPYCGCPCACSCACVNPNVPQSSSAGSSLSLTEGNLSEPVSASTTQSSFGRTLDFSLTYNSYNADGSRAQVDTVMGYGWTHSYNTFLFSQLGAMFRYDGAGRVTRYKLGPGGSFIAATGYFETLVKNPTAVSRSPGKIRPLTSSRQFPVRRSWSADPSGGSPPSSTATATSRPSPIPPAI